MTYMTTYKQPVKELSRTLIWKHTVESLTSKRHENRILNASYMENLWLYCQQQLNEHLDINTFVEWKRFADICYGNKNAENLKVAFFCGNEPENDVRHLIRLGIRIENIYAFEADKTSFKQAVESLHNSFPLLKIYRGKIENYAELQNTKFDIIYLDFTGSLFKEYKTIIKLLDLNALTDTSILAINTTYPDKTDENIGFLCNFFYNDTFFERSFIDGYETAREKDDTWFYRVESCDVEGIDKNLLYNLVESNFEYAYSVFQTAFLVDYANRHKVSYEIFKQDMLANRLVKSDTLKRLDEFHDVLLQEYHEDGERLPSQQYDVPDFMEAMRKNENGAKVSRLNSMKLSEVFLQSPYHHTKTDYSKITSEGIEDYVDVDFKVLLSNEVINVVENINDWFHGKFRFCDLPMEHLWLELLMNQYGHPYHTNIGNHKRFSYTAKTRKMCIDILTLDKCRALYDWMPMLEYFVYDMKDHNRQMITRMCMDAIEKQLLHIVEESYFGAALVGINEYDWSKNKVLPQRIELGSAHRKTNSCQIVFNAFFKTLKNIFIKRIQNKNT